MNCPRCDQVLRENAAFCDSCGFSVASVSTTAASTLSLDQDQKQNDPLLGRVIGGKYKLLTQLGSGGMGAVYRARRIHIGDDVAVKLLHREYVNETQTVERFRREAQAAAMLRHPAVVAIYDFGEARGDDPAFIVMELVEGQTLRKILEVEGALDHHRAVTLLADVCKGVAVAHRSNIVHRDIKPDNIMILPRDVDDGHERVKVVDFGIAKLKDMVAGKTLTQTGRIIGTVYYMSPEQCAAEHLDARADVYSLGAVLYELLTGYPPFTAETATGIVAKHLTQLPPPFPKELAIAPELETVVMRALAKERDDRQSDASNLRTELKKAIGEVPSLITSDNSTTSTGSNKKFPGSNSIPTAPTIIPVDSHPPEATPDRLPTVESKSTSKKRWLITTFALVLLLVGAFILAPKKWFSPSPQKSAESSGAATTGRSGPWQINHVLAAKNRVYAIAFSPDDRSLVTASSEGLREDRDFISELQFWRVENGQEEKSIVEHSEGMLTVAFSPDGRFLATGLGSGNAGGKIGKVKLWDAQTGTLKWAVNGHNDFATCVAFSPDGRTLASASFDKTIKLWDVESGELRKNLPQDSKIYSIAFSPAGNLLAVASQKAVELRAADTNDLKQSFSTDSLAAAAVVFSNDGQVLAGSDVSGKVTVWDTQTGAVKKVFTDHTDVVDALAFSPDGKLLASGGYDSTIFVWDLASGLVVTKLSDTDKVTSVAFSHDGKLLAGGGWSKSVRLWNR